MRDQNRKDARDARDDRRDAMKESAALVEERNLLAELERSTAAEYAWGPQVPILVRSRGSWFALLSWPEPSWPVRAPN